MTAVGCPNVQFPGQFDIAVGRGNIVQLGRDLIERNSAARSVDMAFKRGADPEGDKRHFVGGTDSRHYAGVADNVFRFSGTLVGADDMGRIHATDERVGVDAYADLVRFFIQYLHNTAL